MKKLSFWGICMTLGFLFLMMACSSGTKSGAGNGDDADTTVVKMDVKVTPAMAASMDSFLQAYYSLKDAFVETDSAVVLRAASQLAARANDLPLDKINDPSKKEAVKEGVDSLHIEIAGLAKDSSIKDMRETFKLISGVSYNLIKTVGLKGITVYRTYCPMADGYWLSNSAAIRNPYYGHEMINCGEVKETLEF